MEWRRHLLRRLNRGLGTVLRWCIPARQSSAPPPPLQHAFRRILLVKLVGMGDAVLIRSLAAHLQRRMPQVEIGILGGSATRDVLGVNSRFRVHCYDPAGRDRGLWRAWLKVREIRAESYDVVLDFEQHIVLVAAFLWFTRIPYRVGLAAADNPRSRFQTHSVLLSGNDSMWDAYRALIAVVTPALGSLSTLPLPCSDTARNDVARWWEVQGLDGQRVCALHLGSGARAAARRWPVERFVQLAERLNSGGYADAVVLTGTPAERALAEAFIGAFRGRVADATALNSVERTAEVLRRCRLVVSNDTGVMHLAAAQGTPTVGLFGPNSPQRYAPIGPRVQAVYMPRVACSPCIHVHQGVVPECSHPEKGRCLLDIDVDTVVQAAVQLLPGIG